MRNRADIKTQSEDHIQSKVRWRVILENLFVVVLAFYPLRHINYGLDLWDTGYNYANFQYMGTDHMDPMWLFSTYLANAVGHFLRGLGGGGTLSGMNLYTGLFVSLLALTGFFFCTKVLKLPTGIAFLGEIAAVSLCWCPTALLYNYLTYVLLMACVILLYLGLTQEKKWCLFGAGVCLGANVLVRFSNLPEMALILAVWAYDVILEWDIKKAGIKDIPESFWHRTGRHTLWCLMGYLAVLALLFLNIQMSYGMGAYVEGIGRLFAMTDNATDYKATSMLFGMLHIYVENLYWVVRIGAILAGGVAILFLSGLLQGGLDRLMKHFGENRAKKESHDTDASGRQNVRRGVRLNYPEAGLRIFMGALSLAIGGWLYYLGFWSLLLQGDVTVRQFGMLLLVLIMVLALAYCVGERIFAGLLGVAMLGWLYLREFCSMKFYSYDSILRPGVLFLILAMFICLVRIFHPESPRQEKLIAGIVILLILITSIGSNNGVYPSLNNLFLAAPYTLWQSWRFLRHVGDVWIGKRRKEDARVGDARLEKAQSGKTQSGKARLSVLPAKGLLAAFLVMCLFQFGAFGTVFVFAEATGVQNPDSYVENNAVLRGIRMSEDKAQWLSSLSAYVNENGLQGQEVILYGRIPSLSYYLQMPSAFNPWSDLDSYSPEQMKQDLAETMTVMAGDAAKRPVIILEREYTTYLAGGRSALKELGLGEQRIGVIEQDEKWQMLQAFMVEQGYESAFENGKFTLYR